ncbi:MAG TPA: DUF4430 domain-containing protein [Candidatus Deferrimicrobium sp.]|nr:DUF4430 domain-containing protein [Candidatus Deferrimicrobium sp.]
MRRSVPLSAAALALATGVKTILLTLLVCSCGSDSSENRNAGNIGPQAKDSVVIIMSGADSVSVFELLDRDHDVEFQSTISGVFVTAIDSIKNGDGTYWIYSVNDSMPPVAADAFVTSSGDVVKWHFRRAQR